MELAKVEDSAPAFKRPVRPKKKQKILDEDSYLEALDKIIQRDFFPDLEKLRLQERILEAQRTDDIAKLREIELELRRRSTSVRKTASELRETGFETPRLEGKAGETETETTEETNPKEEEDPLAKVSLDQFLASHTSEDNASFVDILDKMNERKREKYRWLYDREAAAQEARQLLLEGKPVRPALALPYKAANALMYNPEGESLSFKEEQELAKKEPKEIKHNNTRFEGNPYAAKPKPVEQAPAAPTWSTVDSGEKQLLEYRRALREGAIQSFDLDALRGTPRVEPQSPQVNGYGFVVTPSPAIGDASPFVTWGTVDSTPLLLNALNDLPMAPPTPGPSFEIKGLSMREKVAKDLTDQASEAIRKRKTRTPKRQSYPPTSVTTPLRSAAAAASPSATPMLSPAGKLLMSERLKRTSMGPDAQLRASYATPSPLHGSKTRLQTPVKTPSLAAAATPNKLRPVTPKSSSTASSLHTKSSLTDDLLNI